MFSLTCVKALVSATVSMIRRNPTRIELKTADLQELEDKKREWASKTEIPSEEPAKIAIKKSRTERINERIGYDPRPVADDGNPHITIRGP